MLAAYGTLAIRPAQSQPQQYQPPRYHALAGERLLPAPEL
jgi:hypothetical protein